MYEKLKELKFKELIGYAIMSEEAANEYYLKLGENVGELVAHRFKSIARDEEMHKKVLLSLHKDLFETEKYVVPKGLPPFESAVKVETVANLIGALETAMQNEYNAYKIYRFLAKHHKDHKKLFEYLAMMEQGHYDTLKAEKELYEERAMDEKKPPHYLSPYEWTKFQ
jgi:rubrerythrin